MIVNTDFGVRRPRIAHLKSTTCIQKVITIQVEDHIYSHFVPQVALPPRAAGQHIGRRRTEEKQVEEVTSPDIPLLCSFNVKAGGQGGDKTTPEENDWINTCSSNRINHPFQKRALA